MNSVERTSISLKALRAVFAAGVLGSLGGSEITTRSEAYVGSRPIDTKTKEIRKDVVDEVEEEKRQEVVTFYPTPIEDYNLEMSISPFEVEDSQKEEEKLQVADSFIYPLEDGKVTGRGFLDTYVNFRGVRVLHPGEDWNWYSENAVVEEINGFEDEGRDVLTIADAECIFADNVGPGLGNVVIMKHLINVGGEKKAVYSQYSHLGEIRTEVGEKHEQGYILGTVGKTGGHEYPHLDFQIYNDWLYKNYVERYGPNFSLEDLSEEFLREAYYNPSIFIGFRNSLSGR